MPKRFVKRLERCGLPQSMLVDVDRSLRTIRSFSRGETLFRQGSEVHNIYVVEDGWLATPEDLRDGGKLYRDLYMPGDVAGLSELAWVPTTTDLVALTDGTAFMLDRQALLSLGETGPLLTNVFLTIGIAQQVAVTDRLAHALRSDGRGRLLYLLLDLDERCRAVGEDDWIDMPITQSEIADAVGLSKVHVNVLLRDLCAAGVLERDRRAVRLVDRDATAEDVGFRPRLADIDLEWTKSVRISAASDAA